MLSSSSILTAILIYIPLLAAFSGGVDEYDPIITISRIMTFGVVILATMLALRQGAFKNRQNKRINHLLILFFATYVLNFLLGDYASSKWLLNTCGYLFVFFSIATTLVTSPVALLAQTSLKVKSAILLIMTVFIVINTLGVLIDPNAIQEQFHSAQYNSNISFMAQEFNLTKQSLGIIFCLVVVWTTVHWKLLNALEKFIFFAFLVTGFPFWVGIRTSFLCLGLLSFYWALVTKRTLRIALVLTLLPLSVIAWSETAAIKEFVFNSYDRIYPLLFAVNVMTSSFFGLGNGGYHLYVEANNTKLTSQFGSEEMREFWVAPESDLAYFIASFGILSVVFFGFYFFILTKGARLLKRNHFAPLEKFLIISCLMMIFAGVSQDNAGGPIWWSYMAAGFAVILRYSTASQIRNS